MAFDIESTVGILFNRRLASIGSIQLDASVRETHTSSAIVTDHPVEDGSNITDHVIQRPDTITIEGVVSNTTLVFPNGIGLVAPTISLFNSLNNINNDFAQTAYLGLLELMKGKQAGLTKSVSLVTIVTTLRTYENMLIENITVNRDVRSGNALFFTATAREVKLVTTKLADITKTVGARSKKTLGKKTAAPANTGVQTQSDSSLSLISGAGVAF